MRGAGRAGHEHASFAPDSVGWLRALYIGRTETSGHEILAAG